MSQKNVDQLISVIVPTHDQRNLLRPFLTELMSVLDSKFEQFEVILVDDGSLDGTHEEMDVLLTETHGCRYIRLSRHFGTEIALTAGLESAIGDFCVVMLPHLDPPALLPEFVETCEKSDAIVLGQRRDPRGDGNVLFRFARRGFYFICRRFLDLSIPRNSTYFMVLNRKAVNQINRNKDKFRFIRAITTHIGLPTVLVPYDFAGSTKGHPYRNFIESINLSIDVIVMNSVRPLRIASICALTISFLNLAYIGYIVAIFLFLETVQPGWVTLSAQLSVGFFLMFLTLAVLSEYLGRLLQEARARPLYYAVDERSSQLRIANVNRTNVLGEATFRQKEGQP